MFKQSPFKVFYQRIKQFLGNGGFKLWLESEDGHFGLTVPPNCCPWKGEHPEIGPIKGPPNAIMDRLKQELLPD